MADGIERTVIAYTIEGGKLVKEEVSVRGTFWLSANPDLVRPEVRKSLSEETENILKAAKAKGLPVKVSCYTAEVGGNITLITPAARC